ncbi:hypothetical protein PR003_g29803 [Phytophthora rubi]|uniref:Uncharacterized protein n=1 Tax=Phytophthora rubi TaxID=129364 RepID=A0A6A3HCP5_9STRA|nr:hypothetical protein PR001_g28422 [Phytophthora rubi]KAE9273764.1 hypothetical protein PR003_g29803 [Phytophthora rubi]
MAIASSSVATASSRSSLTCFKTCSSSSLNALNCHNGCLATFCHLVTSPPSAASGTAAAHSRADALHVHGLLLRLLQLHPQRRILVNETDLQRFGAPELGVQPLALVLELQ